MINDQPWPTTRGLVAALDADAVRGYLRTHLPGEWGARLDERMKTMRLRNAQVAVLAGTTPQTVSKVRKGELLPRDYLRVMLAAATGTTPDVLFPTPTVREIEAALAPRKRRATKGAAA